MRLALTTLLIAAMAAAPALAAETLTLGRTANGTLKPDDRSADNGGRSHDYTLQLDAGKLVVISARSSDFDTVLILFGPDGNRIAENDDGEGMGTDSLLVVSPQASGRHTVRVNSLPMGGAHTGNYTVRAALVDAD